MSWCHRESRSPSGGGSPIAGGKRSKHSFQSKTFKVEISYAAKIPLKSIAIALKGSELDSVAQDALRVLDIVLRQQAANRYLNLLLFIFVLCMSEECWFALYCLALKFTHLWLLVVQGVSFG